MSHRHITQQGLDLIKKWEGFERHVYLDVAGYPTIGYGHLIKKGESWPNGITEAAAEKLLAKDVQIAERAVIRYISVPLSDSQFNALVSFTFNLGAGALQRSTLRRVLNRGNYAEVPRQLMRWVNAGGRRVRGLVLRRKEEGSIFASESVESEQAAVIMIPPPQPKPKIQGEKSWVQQIFSRLKMGMLMAHGRQQQANQ